MVAALELRLLRPADTLEARLGLAPAASSSSDLRAPREACDARPDVRDAACG